MPLLLPFLLLVLGLTTSLATANNIQVSGLALVSQNPGEGQVRVQFDLAWENSWRTSNAPNNWDAAWVFVKYRINSGPWAHATLAEEGHLAALGSEIIAVPDGAGVFVQRSANGAGTVNFSDLAVLWNYGDDGVADEANIEVQVFAIEMVYVPEGAFLAGDPAGGATNGFRFNRLTLPGNPPRPSSPYRVSSDGAIQYGTLLGFSYTDDEGNPGDQTGPIPEEFPVGFDAFYCMKYETSQDQYVSFFNTLTQSQKESLDPTGADGKNIDNPVARNGISWADSGNATTTLPDHPMTYVAHPLVVAYLDWSGLRPMSEFEFEKACRGPREVTPGEFAWGNANIHDEGYSLVNEDSSQERVGNPGMSTGNGAYLQTTPGTDGPFRVGIFAASATIPNREETGASYYGIMELSGNVYERCVTVGTPGGRAFIPNHGDGTLTVGGSSDVSGWPPPGNSSYRGGAHSSTSQRLRISDRYDGALSIDVKNSRVGFRGVRTAP